MKQPKTTLSPDPAPMAAQCEIDYDECTPEREAAVAKMSEAFWKKWDHLVAPEHAGDSDKMTLMADSATAIQGAREALGQPVPEAAIDDTPLNQAKVEPKKKKKLGPAPIKPDGKSHAITEDVASYMLDVMEQLNED